MRLVAHTVGKVEWNPELMRKRPMKGSVTIYYLVIFIVTCVNITLPLFTAM